MLILGLKYTLLRLREFYYNFIITFYESLAWPETRQVSRKQLGT